jgi:hypothetical protein
MGCAEMLALIRPVRGLMRIRRPSAPLGVTHTDPAPTATCQGSTGKRVGSPTMRFDLGSIRQTAAAGCRVSAHTQPSPVATEKADTGKPIRATMDPWFSGGVDAVLVDLGGFDGVLAEFGGSPVAVQPDAATVAPRAIAAASLNQIGTRTCSIRMPVLRPTRRVGSKGVATPLVVCERPAVAPSRPDALC